MSATHYPHGLGGATGDSLVTNDNFYSTYLTIFVSSVLGDDDNLGITRAQPKATLAAAVTFANTQEYALIVLMEGHGEVVTSTIAMESRICIVGEGRDENGDPTVWLQSNMASGVMLDMNEDLSQLRNVLIKEPLQARTAAEVESDGAYYGIWLKGVKFLVGTNSRGPSLRLDSSLYALVEFCTFKLTEDAHEDSAAGCWSAEACTGLRVRQTTMDNSGGFIWQRTALGVGTAYTEPAANTGNEFEQMRLIGSALMGLHASTTGWVQCDEMTGEARVDWNGAPVRIYPNGLGGNAGPPLITNPNFHTTYRVRYVSSVVGDIGNDGESRDTPWAALEDETGNLQDTDIVIFLDGHEETPAAAIDIGAWHIIGEGSSGGLPTVKFHDNGTLVYIFGVATGDDGASFRNIQVVPPSDGSGAGTAIGINAANGILIDGLYVPANADSDDIIVDVLGSVSGLTLRSCRFTSVGALGNGLPVRMGGTTLVDVKVLGGVFDAGEGGWVQGIGYFEKEPIEGLFMEELSLLRGSSTLHDTLTKGWVSVPFATGESRVDWTSVS